MAVYKIALAVVICCAVVETQRPFYAGLRAIGYPSVQSNVLTNRFSENVYAPIEARGDRDFIQRLNAMPTDNQPFWYLNWRQYEAMRNNPQTYPIRPNAFAVNNF